MVIYHCLIGNHKLDPYIYKRLEPYQAKYSCSIDKIQSFLVNQIDKFEFDDLFLIKTTLDCIQPDLQSITFLLFNLPSRLLTSSLQYLYLTVSPAWAVIYFCKSQTEIQNAHMISLFMSDCLNSKKYLSIREDVYNHISILNKTLIIMNIRL